MSTALRPPPVKPDCCATSQSPATSLAKTAAAVGETTLGMLLGLLAGHPDALLLFTVSERLLSAGYHITEVKTAAFTGLDCGANTESWQEVILQLWDVPAQAGDVPMTAAKARAILAVVETRLGLDPAAALRFEVSDGTSPITIYRVGGTRVQPESLVIDLVPVAASCKPRDRWLAGTPTASDRQLAERRPVVRSACCAA